MMTFSAFSAIIYKLNNQNRTITYYFKRFIKLVICVHVKKVRLHVIINDVLFSKNLEINIIRNYVFYF